MYRQPLLRRFECEDRVYPGLTGPQGVCNSWRAPAGTPRPPVRYSRLVLYSLVYVVVRFLLEVLIARHRSEARLRAEVLVLRHQLAVLERQAGRPPWQPSDRLLMAAMSRVLPRPDPRSQIPRPETLLRWHRGPAQEVAVPAGERPAGVISQYGTVVIPDVRGR